MYAKIPLNSMLDRLMNDFEALLLLNLACFVFNEILMKNQIFLFVLKI